jgi:hypothetical protein
VSVDDHPGGVWGAIGGLQADTRNLGREIGQVRNEIQASEGRLSRGIAEVAQDADDFREEVRSQWRDSARSGHAVVIAIIAACATVLAAIVTAAASISGHLG